MALEEPGAMAAKRFQTASSSQHTRSGITGRPGADVALKTAGAVAGSTARCCTSNRFPRRDS